MTLNLRNISLFAIMAFMIVLVGFFNSWSTALFILNFCLISAVMSLGVNIQWGYAGLLNVGIMGFVALGGVAATLVSIPPVQGAIEAGGSGILFSTFLSAIAIFAIYMAYKKLTGGTRKLTITAISIVSFFVIRHFFDPAVDAIESYDSAGTGNLGGLNMPILFGWLFGGILAAGAAWLVGKISLGLRSDYLAIATLGISEIIIAVLKNEDWLSLSFHLWW